MAKHTPFFKFDSSSWLGGAIQFTDLESKGLFIDLCALYWESEEPIKIDTKFKVRTRCPEGTLNKIIGTLSDLDIIEQTEHGITIPFLDSLMTDRKKWLDKCSESGKKSATNKGTSSNKKEERRKKSVESRKKIVESIKGSNEPPLLETSISPEDIKERPYNRMVLDYMEIYKKIKSFSEQEVFGKIQHALHEAVNNCGTTHLMQTVNDYAYYMSDQPKEKGFASSPVNWLTNRQYNTDWLMRTEGCYTSHTIPDALVDAFSKRSTKHPDMKWEN